MMPVPFPYPTVPGRLLGVDKAGKCLLGVYRAQSYRGKNRITLRISPQFQKKYLLFHRLHVMASQILGEFG